MTARRAAALPGDSIGAASLLNVIARSWEALVNLITVPILLRHLGAEAYGVIGFTQALFAVLGVLDFGLGSAITRELARRELDAAGPASVRMLVRTFEVPLWIIALLLAAALPLSAGFLTRDFVHVETLNANDVTAVFRLFAVVFVCRWMTQFYRGVFFGLERQVRYNVGSLAYATLRFVGGAALLANGRVGLVGLFAWYAATDLLFFVAVRGQILAFERRERATGPAWAGARLRAAGPYALGTMGIGVVALLVTQVDKFLLARARPLAELGAYSFAFAVAMAIRIVPTAMWSATFPRLVRSLEAQRGAEAEALLRAAFRASVLGALALAAPLALFAPDFVALIGGGAGRIELAAPLLTVLAFGVFLEALNGPSYYALLAAGDARALLRLTLLLNALFVAGLALAVSAAGALGAALCWWPLQLAYFVVYATAVRRRGGPVVPGALRAIGPGLAGLLGLAVAARWWSAGASPASATLIAAVVGVVGHLAVGWDARLQQRQLHRSV